MLVKNSNQINTSIYTKNIIDKLIFLCFNTNKCSQNRCIIYNITFLNILLNLPYKLKEYTMFSWAIIFLLVSLVAAALGFGVLSGTAAWAAKLVFLVGLILVIINVITGRKPRV